MNSDSTSNKVSKAERIAARRKATRANIEAQQKAEKDAALIKGTVLVFGEDSLQSAYLRALENAETDPMTYAYRNARGERSHEMRADVSRKRREGEFKYATHWVPSDPTGEAAVSRGTDRLLLQADTFTFPVVGQAGAAVDYEALTRAIGESDSDSVALRVAGSLNLLPIQQKGKTIHTRARSCGFSVADLASASNNYEADYVK